MMNSLQRQAAERKAARDIALANGRGNLAREAFVGDAPIRSSDRLRSLPTRRNTRRLCAAAVSVLMRWPPLRRTVAVAMAVMDGYGGESSFKARGIGDYYDEDYGSTATAAAPRSSKRQPAEPVKRGSGLLPPQGRMR